MKRDLFGPYRPQTEALKHDVVNACLEHPEAVAKLLKQLIVAPQSINDLDAVDRDFVAALAVVGIVSSIEFGLESI